MRRIRINDGSGRQGSYTKNMRTGMNQFIHTAGGFGNGKFQYFQFQVFNHCNELEVE